MQINHLYTDYSIKQCITKEYINLPWYFEVFTNSKWLPPPFALMSTNCENGYISFLTKIYSLELEESNNDDGASPFED